MGGCSKGRALLTGRAGSSTSRAAGGWQLVATRLRTVLDCNEKMAAVLDMAMATPDNQDNEGDAA